MSSVQYLREFVNERLTAATEEILGVFEQTVRVYEEEIDRQRKLLDIVLKPEIKLHRTEILQSVCNDQDLTDQQLSNQERNSGPDQEDTQPHQIKEEKEEQLILEQESELLNLRPSGEGSDDTEDQTLLLDPLPLTDISVKVLRPESDTEDSCLSESNGDHHLAHTPHELKSQECDIGNASTDPKPVNKHLTCLFCGKEFHNVLELNIHRRVHFGEKQFKCDTCGQGFTRKESVWRHMSKAVCATRMKTHKGKKPHSSITSGTSHSLGTNLMVRNQTDTGEILHSCVHCGREFSRISSLRRHFRVHTGEKPFKCDWCGKGFSLNSNMLKHTRLHTGQKLHQCNICERNFAHKRFLKIHKKVHVRQEQQS